MKKLSNVLMAASLLPMCWSCGNKSKSEATPELSISPLAISAEVVANSYTITVTANVAWTAALEFEDLDTAWCEISPTEGTGNGTITVTVALNAGVVPRSATILVGSEGMSNRKSKVVQLGVELSDDEMLIGKLIWATKNVGEPGQFTASPDAPGLLYQFNRNVGYSFNDPCTPEWTVTEIDEDSDWLPQNSPAPEGWRIPTWEEVDDLFSRGFKWRNAGESGYAANGLFVGNDEEIAALATKENPQGCIFIPASGARDAVAGARARDWCMEIQTSRSTGRPDWAPVANSKTRVVIWADGGGLCDWSGDVQSKARATSVRCVRDIK
ncbi:hypothetical protein AGMMS4956_08030 [Bacteroidia bacterium]|nr:hypothetical protein AGMMS4956_08030 [Bacteroidia bacterium]